MKESAKVVRINILARQGFNQAKDMGLTKGHMARIINSGKPVDNFFYSMETIGKLDP